MYYCCSIPDSIDRQFGIKVRYKQKQLLLIDGNPTITTSDVAERIEISLRGTEKITPQKGGSSLGNEGVCIENLFISLRRVL